MCIICVSPRKVRQPSLATIKTMFLRNPHGAGYMFARDGIVHISKGYMDVESYIEALRAEHFTAKDAVVYHFRISTQAGVNPAMTHPFPLSNKLAHMKALDVECRCGVAHNGIIRLTTDPTNKEYDYSSTLVNTSQHLSTDTGKTPYLIWGGPEMELKMGCLDGWGRWKHKPLLQDN